MSVIGTEVTYQQITSFLNSLTCSIGGKLAYYRSLKVFYRWLYSPKSGYELKSHNPILLVESPKKEKRIMPSISDTQLDILLSKAENLRDKIILCLLFDSGMRLSELANIKHSDIDFDTQTVLIIGKGNKQRKAPFTQETSKLLTQYLGTNHSEGNIWGINKYGIQKMLKRLKIETGIKCNPHSFRRGFACQLHKKGLSTLDIMHLGGWSDLGMVLRYTQSITFDDCLVHYHKVMSE